MNKGRGRPRSADRRAASWVASTRNRQFFKGCVGKSRYPSKRVAAGAARVMRTDDPASWARMEAYHCAVCQSWHVGRSGRRGAA